MGDIIGAVTSLIGGSQTNQANWDIAQSANQAAAQRQDAANAFNAQQYATRYQTTVKDLQEAGLNPMLAYGQGAGTPIPANAAPVQQAAPRVNALGNAVSAYQAARQTSADVELKKEQIVATSAQAEASSAQAQTNLAYAVKALEESKKPSQEIENMKKQIAVMSSQILANQAAAKSSTATAANTEQQTSAGIFTGNPITQAWGDIKRGAQWAHDRFSPQLNALQNSAKSALQNRAYQPARK
jgi:hypothetical protein